MKIRHKQSGVEIEDVFESCESGGNGPRHAYFIGRIGSCYDQREWEAVKPEPVWRDVTSQFEPGTVRSCMIFGRDGRELDVRDGYRLRKVKYLSNAFIEGDSINHMHAFIIEKREP